MSQIPDTATVNHPAIIAQVLIDLEGYMPRELDLRYQRACAELAGVIDIDVHPELWGELARAATECHHCGRWKRGRR